MLSKLRLRLTLNSTIVVFCVLIVISMFIFISIDYVTINNIDEKLIDSNFQLKIIYPKLSDVQTDDADMQEYSAYLAKMSEDTINYAISTQDNRNLAYSSYINLDSELLQSIRSMIFMQDISAEKIYERANSKYFVHEYKFEDTHIRVCSSVYSNKNGEIQTAQTFVDMDMHNGVVDNLRGTLVMASIIGGILSFISGYYLAGKMIKPIAQSMKTQQEFIADASHELRTPITIIRTNLDVVKMSPEEDVQSQIDWIENAYDEAVHMQNVVSDLLTIAKMDLKSTALNKELLYICDIVTKSVEKFYPLCESKSIKLIFESKIDFDTVISADKTKIEQLMTIIIDNAIKYSNNEGCVRLELSNAKNAIKIKVEDQGIGIDEEELKNIFKRFYRTDKARSKATGGSGLGLAIAKLIVEAHMGSIVAESIKGEGTTISIYLPN